MPLQFTGAQHGRGMQQIEVFLVVILNHHWKQSNIPHNTKIKYKEQRAKEAVQACTLIRSQITFFLF
jgi:hypothetical protein